jgi:hypothetical protein
MEEPPMYEVAQCRTGELEGRKPLKTEAEARALAAKLAKDRGEAFQVWDEKRMLDVIG